PPLVLFDARNAPPMPVLFALMVNSAGLPLLLTVWLLTPPSDHSGRVASSYAVTSDHPACDDMVSPGSIVGESSIRPMNQAVICEPADSVASSMWSSPVSTTRLVTRSTHLTLPVLLLTQVNSQSPRLFRPLSVRPRRPP